jgi:hypothetical protein
MSEFWVIVDQQADHRKVPCDHVSVLGGQRFELHPNAILKVFGRNFGWDQRRLLNLALAGYAALPLWAISLTAAGAPGWAILALRRAPRSTVPARPFRSCGSVALVALPARPFRSCGSVALVALPARPFRSPWALWSFCHDSSKLRRN